MTKKIGDLYEEGRHFCLPWHDHEYLHGHRVLRGRTLVEIEGLPPLEMTPEDDTIVFEASSRHQITVVEDGTLFFNEHVSPSATPGRSGGVLLDSGEIAR